MKKKYNFLFKIRGLALFAALMSFQSGFAQITATQMGMLDFKVSQNLTVAEMNGTTDVTVKLQAAVNAARTANKSLFIPSGTYKVSNTISCVLTITNWVMSKPVNIIGSAVNHPVIKLADNLTAFKGTTPKSVIHYESSAPSTYGTDCVMEGGIRGIDFDLGTGNTGAVAVYWGCAQYCFIEDLNINARDGFAGLTGWGGANQLLANITVTGGKHALYAPKGNGPDEWGGTTMPDFPHITVSGCTFTGQTQTPIVAWCWGGVTLVGINITTASPTAIQLRSEGDVYTAWYSMIDSKIEFTNPALSNIAIDNSVKSMVTLRGIFVKGAGGICKNGGDEDLMQPTKYSNWTQVKRFNYVFKTARAGYNGVNYDAITGIQSTSAVLDTVVVTSPPADLTSKHIWATTPSFEDANAVLVSTLTAAGIQAAINANPGKTICLPKGTISMSQNITLGSNTKLIGCPGIGLCGTILQYGYTPTASTWLINTVDDAGATTYLMDIVTKDPNDLNFTGSLHWMAGKNSIIRTIICDFGYKGNEANLIRMYFSGNGGGRVFNYQDEKSPDTKVINTAFRKLKIEGTTQQLTFYGGNLERGGAFVQEDAFPLIEMVNASNIRIFGAKSETYQPYATITNCSDVFMTGVVDFANINTGLTKRNLIEISGTSDKIEITNSCFTSPPSGSYFIVKDLWHTNTPLRTQALGVYHRNWSTISDATTSIPVIGVTISPITLALNTGSTGQLTATVAPANATNQTVTWTSSNSAVATVNASGLVTAVAAGTANIIVTTQDGNKTASCYVTVTFVNIPVTGVSMSPTTASLTIGGTSQLTATVAPANATNKTVTWASSNTAVAIVNASGLVTAVAAGNADITATTQDGGHLATCNVTVTAIINHVYNFSGINQANADYNAYACDVDVFPFAGTSANRNTKVEATDAQYTNISAMGTNEWLTVNPGTGDEIFVWVEMKINEAPAAISQINLTFNGYTNGSSAVHKIYVLKAGQAWATSASWVQAGANQTLPAAYTTMTVSITSNISDYIDATGKITWGIYETTSSKTEHINYIELVTIASGANIPVTGVAVSPTTASIGIGGTSQLTATVAPPNATNKTVTWSSNNTAVATVNTSGLVTAVAAGTATITATTQDGGYPDNCIVTVTAAPINIALNKTATASSFETGNTVAMGNDGSTSTRWCSIDGTLNQWWKVDLGATSSITGTEIVWELSNVAYKYKIEVSTDNTAWTVVVDKTTNTLAGQVMSDNFTASVRYVRITVTGLPSGVWTSFYEFKVWGSTGKSPSGGNDLTSAPEIENTVLLKLFPNPATNNLTVELKSFKNAEKMQIFNLTGRLLKEIILTSTKQQISIEDLPKGVYLVRVKNSAVKFIKE
jgi:uncharacterized protein YjdB